MEPETRKLVRTCVWIALVITGHMDAGLGEIAISGCCDVGTWKDGKLFFPGPEPEFWLPISILIFI